jgi:dynein heavy chain
VDVASATFKPWLERVQPFRYNPSLPFFAVLVPTVDTTRYEFLLSTLMGGRHSVLIGGETGSSLFSSHHFRTDHVVGKKVSARP